MALQLLNASHGQLGTVACEKTDQSALRVDDKSLLKVDCGHDDECYGDDDGKLALAQPIAPLNAGIVEKSHMV